MRYDGRVKYALLVLVSAGCTFSVKLEGSTDGAGVDDAHVGPTDGAPEPRDAVVPIDAAPDAMPMWVQVESLVIPCTGQTVTSTTSLASGVSYRLRASGTCIANTFNGSRADAEYAGFNIGTAESRPGNIDLGIAINDITVGASKMPAWGSYTNTHQYTALWIGLGAPIVVMFHDPDFTNNSGSLTLAIDVYQ